MNGRAGAGIVGGGCLVLVCLTCCVGGAFGGWRMILQMTATNCAVGTLHALQRHDAAPGDPRAACFAATPIDTMVEYGVLCHEVDVSLDGHVGRVPCTVTTTTGTTEITVDVVALDGDPEIGAVWFSPDATLGPAWRSDACARWNGHDPAAGEPPAGRVRP